LRSPIVKQRINRDAVDAKERALGDLVPGALVRNLGRDADHADVGGNKETAAEAMGEQNVPITQEKIYGAKARPPRRGRNGASDGAVSNAARHPATSVRGADLIEGGHEKSEESLAVRVTRDLTPPRLRGATLEPGHVREGAIVRKNPGISPEWMGIGKVSLSNRRFADVREDDAPTDARGHAAERGVRLSAGGTFVQRPAFPVMGGDPPPMRMLGRERGEALRGRGEGLRMRLDMPRNDAE